MSEKNQLTAIEQVLTEYVIENANLKLRIKELELESAKKKEGDE